MNRLDFSTGLTLEKDFGANALYGGPFVNVVQDFNGRNSHLDLGGRVGYNRMLTPTDFLQVEGRLWQETADKTGPAATNYGAYTEWEHRPARMVGPVRRR